MNTYKRTPVNAVILFLLLFSTQLRAGDYIYAADVEGMVCAFCAYSVSKNVSQLPGVDADSVDVDLEGGHVRFVSSQPVDEEKLSALFSDSGFSISNLRQSEAGSVASRAASRAEAVILKLELDRNRLEQYSSLLEDIGDLAAGNASRLLIEASTEDEDKLLKPILMGRQQVIKVRFSASKSDTVVIKLYAEKG